MEQYAAWYRLLQAGPWKLKHQAQSWIVCDNFYIKYPGWTNPGDKEDSWLPEAKPQVTGDRFRVLFRVRKIFYNKTVEARHGGCLLVLRRQRQVGP